MYNRFYLPQHYILCGDSFMHLFYMLYEVRLIIFG